MDSHQNPFIGKESSFKLSDEPPKGFKPVISIVNPIPITYDKKPSQIKDSDQSLDIKANALYQEYLKMRKENKLIKTTIEHVKREKAELLQKINMLQSSERDETENKKKRHRRNANQILRAYQCPQENCDKSYGAEASLAQHIKLKHENYYGTPQYDRYIEEINRKNKEESVQ